MPNRRPDASDYAPYYETYVSQVPDEPVLAVLERQRAETRTLIESIDQSRAGHRYAAGKWSIAEVLGHVLDAERVFGFRALHFARNAPGAIPGMDQDTFADNAPYGVRTLASIGHEFDALRAANLEQYASWDASILDRTGIASDAKFSVRALLHIMAGHEAHHMRVLRERYL